MPTIMNTDALLGGAVGTIEDLESTASNKLQTLAAAKQNKINNLSADKLQYQFGYDMAEQIYTRDDGTKFQYKFNEDGTYAHDDKGNWIEQDYLGPTRNLYIDDTKEGNYKLGLARNDLNARAKALGITPAEARYMDKTEFNPYSTAYRPKEGEDPEAKGYDGTPGPRGVTPEDGFLMDTEMPYNLATEMEYRTHTNRGQLANRAMGQGPKTEQTKAEFGDGQTEYTTPDAPMWNIDSTNRYVAPDTVMPSDPRYSNTEYGKEAIQAQIRKVLGDASSSGYTENLIDAAQYGVGSAAARVGDAIADAILTDGAAKVLKEYGVSDDIIKGTDFTALDKYKTAKEYGYDDSRIQEYVKRFKDTYSDDRSTFVDKALVTLEGIIHGPEVLASSSGDMMLGMTGIPGMALMAAGQTNEILAQRKENNDGAENTAKDYTIATASGILYAAVNMLTKGNAGLADVKKVVTEAAKNMDKSALTGVIAKLGKDGLIEGAEEAFQGVTEVLGSKLATKKEDEILTEETALELGSQAALGFGGGVTGKTVGMTKDALTKKTKKEESKPAEPVEETAEVNSEDVTFDGEDDAEGFADAKAAYDIAKSSEDTTLTAVDIAISGTKVLKGMSKKKDIDAKELSEVEESVNKALDKIYNTVYKSAFKGLDEDPSDTEMATMMTKFEENIKELGLGQELSDQLRARSMVKQLGTLADGGKVPGLTPLDLDSINEQLANASAKIAPITVPGMPKNSKKAEDKPAVELTGKIEIPGLDTTDAAVEANVKSKVENKKKEKEKKKKSAEPTDEDLGTKSEDTGTHIRGISARTINKLSRLYKLSPEQVRDAIDLAIPDIQIKKMSGVSKEANAKQYETYYGKDGLLPTYTRYKKAVQDGDTKTAVALINKIRAKATEVEAKLKRYEEVYENVKNRANTVLKAYKDGRYTAEKTAELLGAISLTSGNVTLTGLDTVYGDLDEKVKALAAKPKSGTIEVAQSQVEELGHYDSILALEGMGREKVEYIKVKVADRIKEFTGRVEDLTKEVDRIKAEMEKYEEYSEEWDLLQTELDSAENKLAKDKEALNKYKTKYKGRQYIYRRVYPDKTEGDKATQEKVEEIAGQTAGTVTEEQQKAKEAKGEAVDESKVKKVEKTTGEAEVPAKVAKIKELRKELDETAKKTTEKLEKIKSTLAKDKQLEEELSESSSEAYGVMKDTLGRLYRELEELKTKKKARTKELKDAVKYEDALQKELEGTGETVDGIFKEVRDAEAKLGYTPTSTRLDFRDGKTTLKEVGSIAKKIVSSVQRAGRLVKLSVVKVRRILTTQKVEAVRSELEYIDSKIAKVEADIRANISTAKSRATTSQDVKLVEKVATAMKRKSRLKEQLGKSGGLSEAKRKRVKRIWSMIRELESELYGTALTNAALNNSWVEGSEVLTSPNGNEGNVYLAGMLKAKRTLFGQVKAVQLAELIEDKKAKKMYLDIVNNAVASLSEVVTKPSRVGKDKKAPIGKYEILDSPASYLLWDKDGNDVKMNEQVAAVIALASTEYVANHGMKLVRNSREDVARMLGKLHDWQVTKTEMEVLKEGKMLVNEATSLGGQIASMLGITADKANMPRGQYAQLIADLGMHGLLYAQQQGHIKPLTSTQLSAKEWNSMFKDGEDQSKVIPNKAKVGLVKGKKSNKDKYSKMKDSIKVINEALDIEDTIRDYRTSPVNTEDKEYKIRNGYGEMTDTHQKIMKALEDQEWKLAEEGIEEFVNMDKDVLKTAMGWKDVDALKKEGNTLRSEIEAQEARNQEIEDSIEALQGVSERVRNKAIRNSLYFEWFFAKNGRYLMDTIGLNPQTDKVLSRFLVVPKEAADIEWNMKDEKDYLYFVSGVLQGLGVELDKESTEEILAAGKEVLELAKSGDIDKLRDSLLNPEVDKDGKKMHITLGGITLEPEHPGHTLQAIAALKAYKKSTDGKVKAVVTMEFDAKTSGFALKLLQLPFESEADQAKWLEKTAIYIGDDLIKATEGKGANDMLKTVDDGYQALGIAADEEAGKLKDALDADRYNLWGALKKAEGAIDDMTVTENGVVKATSFARNLFKYPFMRFNYAESISSNKRSLAYDLTQGVLEKIVSGKLNAENAKELFVALGMKAKGLDKQVAELKKKLAEEDSAYIRVTPPTITYMDKESKEYVTKPNSTPVSIEDALQSTFEASYGSVLESVMQSNFGHILEANDTMIAATQVMADGFIAELKKVQDKNMTEKELLEHIKELEKVYPIIRAPYGTDRSEGISIIETSRGKNGEWAVHTHTTNEATPGQTTLTVQSIIREFERAQAAGAVIPTHWTDGAIIGQVLEYNGVLGIHDAIALGLGGKKTEEMVALMNQATWNVSRDYNVMQNILDAYVESVSSMSEDTLAEIKPAKGMTPIEVLKNLTELTNVYNKRRAELFSNKAVVGNIVGYEGSMVRLDGIKEIDGILSPEEKKLIKAVGLDMAKLYDVVEEKVKACING